MVSGFCHGLALRGRTVSLPRRCCSLGSPLPPPNPSRCECFYYVRRWGRAGITVSPSQTGLASVTSRWHLSFLCGSSQPDSWFPLSAECQSFAPVWMPEFVQSRSFLS